MLCHITVMSQCFLTSRGEWLWYHGDIALISWVDWVLYIAYCRVKPKGSFCLLYKWADTAFWLCRANQLSTTRSRRLCASGSHRRLHAAGSTGITRDRSEATGRGPPSLWGQMETFSFRTNPYKNNLPFTRRAVIFRVTLVAVRAAIVEFNYFFHKCMLFSEIAHLLHTLHLLHIYIIIFIIYIADVFYFIFILFYLIWMSYLPLKTFKTRRTIQKWPLLTQFLRF